MTFQSSSSLGKNSQVQSFKTGWDNKILKKSRFELVYDPTTQVAIVNVSSKSLFSFLFKKSEETKILRQWSQLGGKAYDEAKKKFESFLRDHKAIDEATVAQIIQQVDETLKDEAVKAKTVPTLPSPSPFSSSSSSISKVNSPLPSSVPGTPSRASSPVIQKLSPEEIKERSKIIEDLLRKIDKLSPKDLEILKRFSLFGEALKKITAAAEEALRKINKLAFRIDDVGFSSEDFKKQSEEVGDFESFLISQRKSFAQEAAQYAIAQNVTAQLDKVPQEIRTKWNGVLAQWEKAAQEIAKKGSNDEIANHTKALQKAILDITKDCRNCVEITVGEAFKDLRSTVESVVLDEGILGEEREEATLALHSHLLASRAKAWEGVKGKLLTENLDDIASLFDAIEEERKVDDALGILCGQASLPAPKRSFWFVDSFRRYFSSPLDGYTEKMRTYIQVVKDYQNSVEKVLASQTGPVKIEALDKVKAMLGSRVSASVEFVEDVIRKENPVLFKEISGYPELKDHAENVLKTIKRLVETHELNGSSVESKKQKKEIEKSLSTLKELNELANKRNTLISLLEQSEKVVKGWNRVERENGEKILEKFRNDLKEINALDILNIKEPSSIYGSVAIKYAQSCLEDEFEEFEKLWEKQKGGHTRFLDKTSFLDTFIDGYQKKVETIKGMLVYFNPSEQEVYLDTIQQFENALSLSRSTVTKLNEDGDSAKIEIVDKDIKNLIKDSEVARSIEKMIEIAEDRKRGDAGARRELNYFVTKYQPIAERAEMLSEKVPSRWETQGRRVHDELRASLTECVQLIAGDAILVPEDAHERKQSLEHGARILNSIISDAEAIIASNQTNKERLVEIVKKYEGKYQAVSLLIAPPTKEQRYLHQKEIAECTPIVERFLNKINEAKTILADDLFTKEEISKLDSELALFDKDLEKKIAEESKISARRFEIRDVLDDLCLEYDAKVETILSDSGSLTQGSDWKRLTSKYQEHINRIQEMDEFEAYVEPTPGSADSNTSSSWVFSPFKTKKPVGKELIRQKANHFFSEAIKPLKTFSTDQQNREELRDLVENNLTFLEEGEEKIEDMSSRDSAPCRESLKIFRETLSRIEKKCESSDPITETDCKEAESAISLEKVSFEKLLGTQLVKDKNRSVIKSSIDVMIKGYDRTAKELEDRIPLIEGKDKAACQEMVGKYRAAVTQARLIDELSSFSNEVPREWIKKGKMLVLAAGVAAVGYSIYQSRIFFGENKGLDEHKFNVETNGTSSESLEVDWRSFISSLSTAGLDMGGQLYASLSDSVHQLMNSKDRLELVKDAVLSWKVLAPTAGALYYRYAPGTRSEEIEAEKHIEKILQDAAEPLKNLLDIERKKANYREFIEREVGKALALLESKGKELKVIEGKLGGLVFNDIRNSLEIKKTSIKNFISESFVKPKVSSSWWWTRPSAPEEVAKVNEMSLSELKIYSQAVSSQIKSEETKINRSKAVLAMKTISKALKSFDETKAKVEEEAVQWVSGEAKLHPQPRGRFRTFDTDQSLSSKDLSHLQFSATMELKGCIKDVEQNIAHIKENIAPSASLTERVESIEKYLRDCEVSLNEGVAKSRQKLNTSLIKQIEDFEKTLSYSRKDPVLSEDLIKNITSAKLAVLEIIKTKVSLYETDLNKLFANFEKMPNIPEKLIQKIGETLSRSKDVFEEQRHDYLLQYHVAAWDKQFAENSQFSDVETQWKTQIITQGHDIVSLESLKKYEAVVDDFSKQMMRFLTPFEVVYKDSARAKVEFEIASRLVDSAIKGYNQKNQLYAESLLESQKKDIENQLKVMAAKPIPKPTSKPGLCEKIGRAVVGVATSRIGMVGEAIGTAVAGDFYANSGNISRVVGNFIWERVPSGADVADVANKVLSVAQVAASTMWRGTTEAVAEYPVAAGITLTAGAVGTYLLAPRLIARFRNKEVEDGPDPLHLQILETIDDIRNYAKNIKVATKELEAGKIDADKIANLSITDQLRKAGASKNPGLTEKLEARFASLLKEKIEEFNENAQRFSKDVKEGVLSYILYGSPLYDKLTKIFEKPESLISFFEQGHRVQTEKPKSWWSSWFSGSGKDYEYNFIPVHELSISDKETYLKNLEKIESEVKAEIGHYPAIQLLMKNKVHYEQIVREATTHIKRWKDQEEYSKALRLEEVLTDVMGKEEKEKLNASSFKGSESEQLDELRKVARSLEGFSATIKSKFERIALEPRGDSLADQFAQVENAKGDLAEVVQQSIANAIQSSIVKKVKDHQGDLKKIGERFDELHDIFNFPQIWKEDVSLLINQLREKWNDNEKILVKGKSLASMTPQEISSLAVGTEIKELIKKDMSELEDKYPFKKIDQAYAKYSKSLNVAETASLKLSIEGQYSYAKNLQDKIGDAKKTLEVIRNKIEQTPPSKGPKEKEDVYKTKIEKLVQGQLYDLEKVCNEQATKLDLERQHIELLQPLSLSKQLDKITNADDVQEAFVRVSRDFRKQIDEQVAKIEKRSEMMDKIIVLFGEPVFPLVEEIKSSVQMSLEELNECKKYLSSNLENEAEFQDVEKNLKSIKEWFEHIESKYQLSNLERRKNRHDQFIESLKKQKTKYFSKGQVLQVRKIDDIIETLNERVFKSIESLADRASGRVTLSAILNGWSTCLNDIGKQVRGVGKEKTSLIDPALDIQDKPFVREGLRSKTEIKISEIEELLEQLLENLGKLENIASQMDAPLPEIWKIKIENYIHEKLIVFNQVRNGIEIEGNEYNIHQLNDKGLSYYERIIESISNEIKSEIKDLRIDEAAQLLVRFESFISTREGDPIDVAKKFVMYSIENLEDFADLDSLCKYLELQFNDMWTRIYQAKDNKLRLDVRNALQKQMDEHLVKIGEQVEAKASQVERELTRLESLKGLPGQPEGLDSTILELQTIVRSMRQSDQLGMPEGPLLAYNERRHNPISLTGILKAAHNSFIQVLNDCQFGKVIDFDVLVKSVIQRENLINRTLHLSDELLRKAKRLQSGTVISEEALTIVKGQEIQDIENLSLDIAAVKDILNGFQKSFHSGVWDSLFHSKKDVQEFFDSLLSDLSKGDDRLTSLKNELIEKGNTSLEVDNIKELLKSGKELLGLAKGLVACWDQYSFLKKGPEKQAKLEKIINSINDYKENQDLSILCQSWQEIMGLHDTEKDNRLSPGGEFIKMISRVSGMKQDLKTVISAESGLLRDSTIPQLFKSLLADLEPHITQLNKWRASLGKGEKILETEKEIAAFLGDVPAFIVHLGDIIKYWKEYQDIASKEMKEQVLKTFKESAGRYNKKQEDLAIVSDSWRTGLEEGPRNASKLERVVDEAVERINLFVAAYEQKRDQVGLPKLDFTLPLNELNAFKSRIRTGELKDIKLMNPQVCEEVIQKWNLVMGKYAELQQVRDEGLPLSQSEILECLKSLPTRIEGVSYVGLFEAIDKLLNEVIPLEDRVVQHIPDFRERNQIFKNKFPDGFEWHRLDPKKVRQLCFEIPKDDLNQAIINIQAIVRGLETIEKAQIKKSAYDKLIENVNHLIDRSPGVDSLKDLQVFFEKSADQVEGFKNGSKELNCIKKHKTLIEALHEKVPAKDKDNVAYLSRVADDRISTINQYLDSVLQLENIDDLVVLPDFSDLHKEINKKLEQLSEVLKGKGDPAKSEAIKTVTADLEDQEFNEYLEILNRNLDLALLSFSTKKRK